MTNRKSLSNIINFPSKIELIITIFLPKLARWENTMQLEWKAVFMILKAKIQDRGIYIAVGEKFQGKNKHKHIILQALTNIYPEKKKFD